MSTLSDIIMHIYSYNRLVTENDYKLHLLLFLFIYRVIIIALFTPIINIQNVFSTLSHHNTANCSACYGDYNYYLDRSNVQTEYQSNLFFVTILLCLGTIQCRKYFFHLCH